MLAALPLVACGNGQPTEASLRDSFAQQVASNNFIRE
jgi:hypothetical protein